MDLKRFASCLKKAIRTDAAYEALDAGPISGDWLEGGCWTLAHAVAGLLDGELWAFVSRPKHSQTLVVQHVVVKVGNKFIDGDGLWTENDLFDHFIEVVERWPTFSGHLDLVPFTPRMQATATRREWAICDTRAATAILPALMKCARRR